MLTFICPGLWVEVWKLDLQRFQGGKYFFLVSLSSLPVSKVAVWNRKPLKWANFRSFRLSWTWSRRAYAGLANKIIHIIYIIRFYIILFFPLSWTWNRRGTLQDLLSTNKTANGISSVIINSSTMNIKTSTLNISYIRYMNISGVPSRRNEVPFDGEPYVDVTFTIKMRRRSLY